MNLLFRTHKLGFHLNSRKYSFSKSCERRKKPIREVSVCDIEDVTDTDDISKET